MTVKNFDQDDERVLDEADKTFTIRGVTFTRRDKVRPEAIAMIEDSAFEPSSIGVIEMMDRGISEYLVPGDRPLWDAVRGKPWRGAVSEDGDVVDSDPHAEIRGRAEDNPIQIHEMRNVGQWLVEVETRLPTTQPSASPDGASSTERSSTAASSSGEATREG